MTSSTKHKLRAKDYLRTWHFWLVHAVAIGGVALSGWSWNGFLLAVGLYYLKMFFITAGYHRYFSHRTYKTSRIFQFILATGATLSIQKGPLWWASQHRHHHKHSDEEDDIHSPKNDGFWWAHVGWILVPDYESTRFDLIKDFAKYPELRFLNTYHVLPPIVFGIALAFIGGWPLFLWGSLVSSVLSWHGTFTINSLSHVFGSRPYNTSDTSTNNILFALLTMGEGWHNNHHHYMNSTNQGFKWYQIDLTYYLLKMLNVVGVVWDLRTPPKHIIENRPKRPHVANEEQIIKRAA